MVQQEVNYQYQNPQTLQIKSIFSRRTEESVAFLFLAIYTDTSTQILCAINSTRDRLRVSIEG